MQGNVNQRQEKGDETQAGMTESVAILTGDPKKAILTLSGSMIIALLVTNAYNLVNGIWVTGLGSDSLAAVGFINPVFLVVFGLSCGVASGVASSISRKIGAKDKPGADGAAMNALFLVVLMCLVLALPLCLLTEPIVRALGVGTAFGQAVVYGRIIFAGSVFIIFQNIAYAILRAEGDTRRTMHVMIGASLLNVILDPILIYCAGMGISGAAWGTVLSTAAGSAVLIYWLMVKKDTYVSLNWGSFSPSIPAIFDILQVGLPASLEFLLLSVDAFIINSIMAHVSGNDAVAVYTGGWRVVVFLVMPLIAISSTVLSVAGASFGAKRYRDLSLMHNYSVKLGLAIGLAISAITWVLAPQIAYLFAYSQETSHLMPVMTSFLRTMCLYYPFMSFGVMSSAIFQGVGKGFISFVLNFMRIVLFIAGIAYITGVVLGIGQEGVWWGIVIGNFMGSTASYIWTRLYIRRLEQKAVSEKPVPVPESNLS